jgi:hypothetical protein
MSVVAHLPRCPSLAGPGRSRIGHGRTASIHQMHRPPRRLRPIARLPTLSPETSFPPCPPAYGRHRYRLPVAPGTDLRDESNVLAWHPLSIGAEPAPTDAQTSGEVERKEKTSLGLILCGRSRIWRRSTAGRSERAGDRGIEWQRSERAGFLRRRARGCAGAFVWPRR